MPINYQTHPDIVHRIASFAMLPLALTFRRVSRSLRDGVDRCLFHTAALVPLRKNWFVLRTQPGGRRLPWIPVYMRWPALSDPPVAFEPYPSRREMRLSPDLDRQLRFVRDLIIEVGSYLSSEAFVWPALRQLFNTLDFFNRLEVVYWTGPSAPPRVLDAMEADVASLRYQLPVSTTYTYYLPVGLGVLSNVVAPPGIKRVNVFIRHQRTQHHWDPPRDDTFDFGPMDMEGHIGQVVFTVTCTGGGGGAKSQRKCILGLLGALGVAIKRSLAHNTVRPCQLRFIFVGLEALAPTEVGILKGASHERIVEAAARRILHPRLTSGAAFSPPVSQPSTSPAPRNAPNPVFSLPAFSLPPPVLTPPSSAHDTPSGSPGASSPNSPPAMPSLVPKKDSSRSVSGPTVFPPHAGPALGTPSTPPAPAATSSAAEPIPSHPTTTSSPPGKPPLAPRKGFTRSVSGPAVSHPDTGPSKKWVTMPKVVSIDDEAEIAARKWGWWDQAEHDFDLGYRPAVASLWGDDHGSSSRPNFNANGQRAPPHIKDHIRFYTHSQWQQAKTQGFSHSL